MYIVGHVSLSAMVGGGLFTRVDLIVSLMWLHVLQPRANPEALAPAETQKSMGENNL